MVSTQKHARILTASSDIPSRIFLKLENLQPAGSFKSRSVFPSRPLTPSSKRALIHKAIH